MKKNYFYLLMLLFPLAAMFKSSSVFAADPPKEEYDAAMAAITDGTYYITTDVDGVKYYVTQGGGMTADKESAYLFPISKVDASGAEDKLFDAAWLIDPENGRYFSNTTVTDDKADLHIGQFRQGDVYNRDDWERQVFYLKDGKFAIRSCNIEYGESSWWDAGRTFWSYEIAELENGLSYSVPCYSYEPAYVWTLESSSNSSIFFIDSNVKAICVSNWDTNGDGELSYGEATAVTDLGTVFRANGDITSFNELQYFIGLTCIRKDAFHECKGLTSITIPNSVMEIGDFAFQACSLTAVRIPSSVTAIATGRSFSDNPTLTSIIVEDGNPVYDSRNNCNAIIETSTNKLIVGCKNTVIPSTVKIIDYKAFRYQGLSSINIPEGVTTIENYAFRGSGLTSVAIPSTVATLGDNAFCECDLAMVKVLSAQPLPITENTFPSRANATLYIPVGSKAAYEAADYWKDFKEIIEYDYVKVNNISIAAGESKSFEIDLVNQGTDVVGFQMDITLPEGVGIDKTGCTLSSRITDDAQELTIGKLESGIYRITFTSLSLTPISGNDGALLTLKLTTEDGCVGGQVTISNIIFSTSESEKIIMSDESFDIGILYKVIYKVDDEVYKTDEFVCNTVPVLADGEPTKDGYTFGGWSALPEVMPNHNVEITGRFYLYGDVNTDEDVDVVDVVDIARFVVATPSAKFRAKLADLNKDNTVNIADAVTLVNHIAGDQNFVKAMNPLGLSYNYDQCQLQLLSFGQNALSLCLDGEADFTAFQFEVDVPEGTDISAIRINGMRKNGHQLLYSKVEENRYRVTALSLSNSVFKGSNGELLLFSVDGQTIDDICIHDIHFVTTNGTDLSYDALYVSGTVTGIADVNANRSNDVIYDLQGRKLSKVRHGVNITNGKKVVVNK